LAALPILGAMRAAAVISCLVAALGVLSGCAPGSNGELRTLVEEATLSGSSGCEWGSSSFEAEPKSWYGCWDFASGELQRVARAYKSRLAAQGFAVSSDADALGVALTGVRGENTLCIDVLTPAFVAGRNTSPSEVDVPPGELFVDIWAVEPREAGVAPCAPLPANAEFALS
jgi:hypothetical protein